MNLTGAEIIVIGNEILAGKRTDTNSSFLGKSLAAIGIEVKHKVTIRDDRREIRESLAQALSRSGLILTSGGLGPTLDDVTRETLAEATGISLRIDPGLLETIRRRFKDRGIPFSRTNECQAFVPENGGFYPNPNGTAPGLYFETPQSLVVALPGPPRELEPIVRNHLVPHLLRVDSSLHPRVERGYLLCGTGESNIDQRIRGILRESDPISISSIPHPGIVEVTFLLQDESEPSRERFSLVIGEFEDTCGEYIVGPKEKPLEEVIGSLLKSREETLAVAESCTGGLIGGRITGVPGSSDYFLGGVMSYSNDIKAEMLGVPEELLKENGAVSEPVAGAMARGVRKRLHADWGISVTGIAGPGGGSSEKPVGLVYTGVSGPGAEAVERHLYFGNREMVRERTIVGALNLLRLRLLAGATPRE